MQHDYLFSVRRKADMLTYAVAQKFWSHGVGFVNALQQCIDGMVLIAFTKRLHN